MSRLALQADLVMGNPVSVRTGLLFDAMELFQFFSTFFNEERSRPQQDSLEQRDRTEINLALQGDGDAFANLIERHQKFVANRMWKFTNNAAEHEELVHNVFVEAFYNLSKFRFEGSFAAWLRTIATRQGYRYWKQRDRNRKQKPLSPNLVESLAAVENGTDRQHAAELLRSLLEQLPPRDRLVLTLLYWEQCSMEQAAELAGWSVTMTKVQAYRARQKLKRLMEKKS